MKPCSAFSWRLLRCSFYLAYPSCQQVRRHEAWHAVATLVCTERASADSLSPPSRFGFIKYKAREAARAALETLGGKQMADFPGQAVSAPCRASPQPLLRPSFPHPYPSMPSMPCNPDQPLTP